MPAPQWMDHGGGKHRLAVAQDEVAGGGGFAHEVEEGLAGRQIEVQVNLRTPQVGVGRERVPDAARIETRETHDQLAGGQAAGVDQLEERALVGALAGAEALAERFGEGDVRGRMRRVRRIGLQPEPRGLRGGDGGEHHVLHAAPEIERVVRIHAVILPVRGDATRSAEVDDAGLAAFEEERRAQLRGGGQGQRRAEGHGRTEDGAVGLPPMQVERPGPEQPGHHELAAQFLRRHRGRQTHQGIFLEVHGAMMKGRSTHKTPAGQKMLAPPLEGGARPRQPPNKEWKLPRKARARLAGAGAG